MSNLQIFWCDTCQKKYFFDEITEGIEVSKVQKTIPFLDPETQKRKKPVFLQRKQKHKCSKCGYIMKEVQNAANRNNSP